MCGLKTFSWYNVIYFVWSKFYFVCAVIMPIYRKTTKIFGILGVIAKILYGYWSSHPCLVGPNVARVSIIEAEKCTRIDVTCGVTINDELPSSHF